MTRKKGKRLESFDANLPRQKRAASDTDQLETNRLPASDIRTRGPPELPTNLDELVDEEWLADYYDQSTRTIKLWRYQGRGPQFIRLSKTQVRYRWGAILEHNQKLTARSTAEETVRKTEGQRAA